jgi:peptidoglycan-N-acetylglucosamine deacetylase
VLAIAGLVVVAALAFAFKPGASSRTPVQVESSQSAIERAAEKAAKNAVAGAKAAEAVEQRLWSNGQFVSKVPPSDGVNAGTNAGNVVALTFDDGPGKETWDVLALLKRYRMRATFFVTGLSIVKNPGALAAIVADGHVVGDHTWTHASLPSLKPPQLKAEIADTQALIEQETGHKPTTMRPPFGDFTAKTNEFVRARGMLPVLWTIDSNDWALRDASEIAANVLNSPQLKPGAIILLHDGSINRQVTVDALLMILDGLVARGLRSVTVPELLRVGPPSIARPGDYKLSDYATG